MSTEGPAPIDELVALRRELHAHPERSGLERETARRMRDLVAGRPGAEVHTGLGGHGVAAVWRGPRPGPRVLLRAELDALPIPERLAVAHRSTVDGCAHKCGHDGHLAILAGVAARLAERPPTRGAAVLLFQPAEEDGSGAARVIDDPAFAPLAPDLAFALHNLPGFERGAVVVRDGPFAAASTGLLVRLSGATAHAAEPQRGRTPAPAVATLIAGIGALPQLETGLDEGAKATVIHARLGELAFGTSPGEATVAATLRAHDAPVLERIAHAARRLIVNTAAAHELACAIETVEPFPPTACDADANRLVRAAAADAGLAVVEPRSVFPWSEDFGHFTARFGGALFGLGAGADHPALHHPDYDFPDELIPLGVELLDRILERTVRAADPPASGAGS